MGPGSRGDGTGDPSPSAPVLRETIQYICSRFIKSEPCVRFPFVGGTDPLGLWTEKVPFQGYLCLAVRVGGVDSREVGI